MKQWRLDLLALKIREGGRYTNVPLKTSGINIRSRSINCLYAVDRFFKYPKPLVSTSSQQDRFNWRYIRSANVIGEDVVTVRTRHTEPEK